MATGEAVTALLALDIATKTGFAVLEDLGHGVAPRVRCGSWHCQGGDFDAKCEALSDHLTGLLRDLRGQGVKPTLAAVEEPIRRLPMVRRRVAGGMFASEPVEEMVSNPNTMLVLPAMIGAACAILRQFKVRKVLVAPATWRKSFIGMSRAPRTIERGKTSQWLKAEVRRKAELLGQKYDFHVPNNDASDAVGISFWLAANEGLFAACDALRKQAA